MLTEKGKAKAELMGVILVMIASGHDEKTIAEELGVSRGDVAQQIFDAATILDDYMKDGREDWD